MSVHATEDLLTDDELVALAVDTGGRWPLPLPTVDVTDPEALGRSALRGLRSLVLRELLDHGGRPVALEHVVAAVQAPATLVAFLGTRDARPLGWAFGFGAVATDEGWLLDEIGAAGVHRFRRAEADSAVSAFFTAMLDGVVAEGIVPLPDGSTPLLHLATSTAAGGRALAVGDDVGDGGRGAWTYTVGPGGEVSALVALDVPLDQAVADLVTLATARA